MNTKKSIKIFGQVKLGFVSVVAAATLAMLFGTLAAHAHAAEKNPISLRIELDRSVLPAKKADKAIVKISLDGLRRERAKSRPPVNLVIVLDRSGSMSGDKLTQAKAAAIEALNRLAADDIFSLVTFDSNVETVIPATRVGNGEALESRIRQIRSGGNTALYAGVSQGASELRKNMEDSRYIHRIILLSDGQANQGPSTPTELGRFGAALVKEGISVTTVGLGLGYDEDLMTRLALRSDGNTYFVEGSSDLRRIFNAEIGDVLNVVARRVVIDIEFPSEIRPVRFIGREGVITGQKAEVSLNQIYGGQEKYVLMEVEVPAREENSECTVVNAKVIFEDPVLKTKSTISGTQNASFSASEEAVIKSANHSVQTAYAKNVVAIVQEEAIGMIDAGKQKEAAEHMARNAAILNASANAYGNADAIDISEDLEKTAKSVESQGYGYTAEEKSQNRKGMKSKAASTITQQRISGAPSQYSKQDN